MGLREYRRKRNFERTAEPAGDEAAGAGAPASAGRRFVVQKHAASRLHYDLRLEWDGVLKSWAVPKGPSLDPGVRALAVQVEDHPLDYANFEGVIPKGEYGGGTVMVWDRGEWSPLGDTAAGLRRGRLKFVLDGEKLTGEWALVRMRDDEGDGKNWLLLKHDDDAARSRDDFDVTEELPTSVLSQRTLEEIAAAADRTWSPRSRKKRKAEPETSRKPPPPSRAVLPDPARTTNAVKARMPRELLPQLATATMRVPEGDDWLHELKFDGYRLLAFVEGDDVRLVTRRGHDWTDRFADLVEPLRRLGLTRTILDGEVVVLDPNGVSNFQRLQNRMKRRTGDPLVYYVFDAPYVEGFDLRRTPLLVRKELLRRTLLASSPENDGAVRYGDHIRGRGPAVLQQSCQHALEGIVSKRIDAAYESRRSRSWLKSKCVGRQEFVIGGFTAPQRSRSHLGALLVGHRSHDRWVYCGRVGTGFTEETLADLARRLQRRKRDSPPFAKPPTGAQARGVTWVEPELVAEVEFAGWTDDGMLRHASFQGLREDKLAEEVVREAGPQQVRPKATPRASPQTSTRSTNGGPMSQVIAGVTISNGDRVVYPQGGLTKFGLAAYYESVADWILPYVVNRPLTLVRCPKGRLEKCFYQKHWKESLPDAVDSVAVREKAGEEPYVVVRDLAGLISLVQFGVLELHPWGARADRLDRPDTLVFDLDPGDGVAWREVVRAAVEIREFLRQAGLESFVRTSGGKGLHVVVPITRRSDWDEVAEFAADVAAGFARRFPDRYVANMRKQLRRGKIFLDHLRNRRGATSVASYSTRARAGAPVATPLDWAELPDLEASDDWTAYNVPERLATLTADPWEGFGTLRQSITRHARAVAATGRK
jgi:bifunctional non-homologous end joining protein LigD